MPLCDEMTLQATEVRRLHDHEGPAEFSIRAGVESNGGNYVPIFDVSTGTGSFRFYLTGPRAIALGTILCESGRVLAQG